MSFEMAKKDSLKSFLLVFDFNLITVVLTVNKIHYKFVLCMLDICKTFVLKSNKIKAQAL